MVFAILLISAYQTSADQLDILGVDVVPTHPLDTDLITFNISGWAAGFNSVVDYDLFSQNGTSLQLDLYVNQTPERLESYWNYSKQIQPLPIGTYGLEVRAFDNSFVYGTPGALVDTYNVNFTVVPEPASAAMLAIGTIFLASSRKRPDCFVASLLAIKENYRLCSTGRFLSSATVGSNSNSSIFSAAVNSSIVRWMSPILRPCIIAKRL